MWKILRKLALHGRPYFIVKDGEVAWDGRSLFLWHLASLQFVEGMENIWLCMGTKLAVQAWG